MDDEGFDCLEEQAAQIDKLLKAVGPLVLGVGAVWAAVAVVGVKERAIRVCWTCRILQRCKCHISSKQVMSKQ